MSGKDVRQEAKQMRVAGMSLEGGAGGSNSTHEKLNKMDNVEALKHMMVGAEQEQKVSFGVLIHDSVLLNFF